MKKIESFMVTLNKIVVALLLAVCFGIVLANVIGRYGFNYSFSWAEEAARHLMILCAFSASGLALREGKLVAITILPDILPPFFQSLTRWLIVAIMFAFMLVLAWLGVKFVQFGWNKETTSTGVSRGIPYMAIPIGCLLFLIQLSFFAKRFVRYEFESTSPESASKKG